MDFKWISAGELEKGQFVTILGLRPVTEEVLTPMGEKHTITKEDKSPWIKGTPFRILSVKLPLVMLQNVCNAPNIPPVVFYDTRLVEFLEIDEEYAASYAAAMFPQQIQLQVMEAQKAAEEDPQQIFNFGSEGKNGPDENGKGGDDGETGGPPLVPA